MSYLHDQITIELKRIDIFEAAIEKCKKRIESLKFLMEDSDDELDMLSSNTLAKLGSNTAVKNISASLKGMGTLEALGYVRSKPIGDNQLKLLRFIGKEGKALKDMVAFAKTNNLNMTDQNVRNFAMIYRKRYEYIESPYMAFYRLTPSGEKAIEK